MSQLNFFFKHNTINVNVSKIYSESDLHVIMCDEEFTLQIIEIATEVDLINW